MTISDAPMLSGQRITEVFAAATDEFRSAVAYRSLVSGEASHEIAREFICNVFRTHYLSAHIVALCFASVPSKSSALLKENLLEEMGGGDHGAPHAALLVELARGGGFAEEEIASLAEDARQRLAVFSAARVPAASLREICLSVLLETMSFEFMLSRCSGEIAGALAERYGFPEAALRWFELHSEVDIRHAEEGIAVIQDYLAFHQISETLFEAIAKVALGGDLFLRHYFPALSRQRTGMRAAPGTSRRIESITIYQLRIPFRQAFRHALQSREESDAVIVKISDQNGQSGYGEGLPRSYVTGESVASMSAWIAGELAPQIFSQPLAPGWETLEYLESMLPAWTMPSGANGPVAWNAAFCAVELALLDWSLRLDHCALADLLPPARYEVVYSGVISADAPKHAAALAKRMTHLGIRDIKVKVGTSGDAARLKAVRQAAGDDVDLRADANGAWEAEQAIAELGRLARFNLRCIEQPVPASDLAGMKRVREHGGIAVMADESLVTVDQARALIELRACDHFNIRLSKCGGISGALAIARLAEQAGIKVQVGAQVGETGILSAAGRTFAAHLPSLIWAEGSFGTWLLAEDVTFENVAFGAGGRAPLLKNRGLSVTVNEEVLERLATNKIELRR